jgi:hypothetical protein
MIFKWQNRFIFFPPAVINSTPQEWGLSYEDIWLDIPGKDPQQEGLHGWWIPANSSTQKVLLYLHGNGSNISSHLRDASQFQRLGFSVFLLDYRGYGKSKGEFPTESQVYQDSQIAWDYLVKTRNIDPKNIFIYGHSLGGAITIDLASKNPSVAGLIIEGSFTSIRDMIDYQKVYQIFPTDLLLTQKFDSMSKLPRLSMPILLIHGTDDQVVPASMSQVLFKAAKSPKKLLLVPQADHNNVSEVSGQQYWQTIQDFEKLVRNHQYYSKVSQ